jgi:hypothetical protein
MSTTHTLFRPVGAFEMLKILHSGGREFPPRLPEQPIFYPVLNREYAESIAQRWNTQDSHSSHAGFVTRFQVAAEYASHFEEHIVGPRTRAELWVPAEELAEFNAHIVGAIDMIEVFYGPRYTGPIPEHFGLAGRDARQQFICLWDMRRYSSFDFEIEVGASDPYVRLNFAYWARADFADVGLAVDEKTQLLEDVLNAWRQRHPDEHLLGADEIGCQRERPE